MKIYISSFYNVRNMKSNMIPLSTAAGWPYWIYKWAKQKEGTCFLDNNKVINGINIDMLHFPAEKFEELEEPCSKNCLYKDKAPNCQFMISYYNYLKTLDFNKVIDYFNQIAEEIKLINHYKGEPIIVLLVYESSKCICAERPVLQKWFKENGINLQEWTSNIV